ncbi:SpoIIE family protein phosphatase [Candidatus Peregrinibacteria bacterium]|nr:SpoIIE family protein phosphatase [Candidatus Peregrinibacteria bacterium]
MVLIIGLFSFAAFLLIKEKQKELTQNIFFQARSFGELTSSDIINNYRLYLVQKGFIYFNREISSVFQKTLDIDLIQIYDYSGELLYDSMQEKREQYAGPVRLINDQILLSQVKAHNPSLITNEGKVYFLKKSELGEILYVDENENPIESLKALERIKYLVFPVLDQYAVLYHLNYDNLDILIRNDQIRIGSLALLGMVIGLLSAIFFANQITRPIRKLTKGSGIIATGNFKHRVEIKTHDELEILGNAFNKMAADLDVSTKALVYKERVAKELELAQKIQQELIPKQLPALEGLDIAAGLVPAEEIGGDVYDFLKKDEKNTMFYLGDVTGHGVPSGLVGSIANAIFFSHKDKLGLKEIMVEVNKVLKAKSPPNMFITLCLLNWNSELKKLSYVNAGHEQMIRFNSAENNSELLKGGGIALGMFPDIANLILEQEASLNPGDCVVLYSDGIPEAWKNPKEIYGMDRFKEAVKNFGNLDNATAIRNAILQDVKNFIGDYKQMDDITILVIKRTS